MRDGPIALDWQPTELGANDAPMSVIAGKQIRGKTIFKDDLLVFMALANESMGWRWVMEPKAESGEAPTRWDGESGVINLGWASSKDCSSRSSSSY